MTDYHAIIILEHGKRGGRPCIRGMRITVADILGWLAEGLSPDAIMGDFPELTREDISAALADLYAGSTQVRLIGLDTADDHVLWRRAARGGRGLRGKRGRAEPVALLYEQARVAHALGLDALEDQMLLLGPGPSAAATAPTAPTPWSGPSPPSSWSPPGRPLSAAFSRSSAPQPPPP